jgi:hypothetical protein
MKLFGLYNEDEDENDDEYDSGLTLSRSGFKTPSPRFMKRAMAALSRVAGFPV